MKESKTVIFLRHGMTAGNRQKKYIGVTDEPLCEEGIRLLRQKSGYPRVSQVVVSPMVRCRQTAEILFPHARQIVIPDLAEMNFGIFENRAYAGDLENCAEYQAWLDSYCEAPVPDGESREIFETRCVRGFLEGIRQMQALAAGAARIPAGSETHAADAGRVPAENEVLPTAGEEPAVFVVHGGTVMSILHRFGRPAKEYYQWNPANGSGYCGIWNGEVIQNISEISS